MMIMMIIVDLVLMNVNGIYNIVLSYDNRFFHTAAL